MLILLQNMKKSDQRRSGLICVSDGGNQIGTIRGEVAG